MTYVRSSAMMLLEQLLAISDKSLPELLDVEPNINWAKVLNNAVSQNIAKPSGDFHFTTRKFKRYSLVPKPLHNLPQTLVTSTDDTLQSAIIRPETPPCFSPEDFHHWLSDVRLSKDYTTICADCDQNSILTQRIRAAGRCHKDTWQNIFFGFKPKTPKAPKPAKETSCATH
jgi:hypothetical protein